MFDAELIKIGLKTIAMLLVVLGLLILALYIMKRFVVLKGKSKGQLPIEVLSTHYLSPKARIEVVSISGEKIVLGITPGSIHFLTKLVD
jgi:flagellar biosynthetic protein FliO